MLPARSEGQIFELEGPERQVDTLDFIHSFIYWSHGNCYPYELMALIDYNAATIVASPRQASFLFLIYPLPS